MKFVLLILSLKVIFSTVNSNHINLKSPNPPYSSDYLPKEDTDVLHNDTSYSQTYVSVKDFERLKNETDIILNQTDTQRKNKEFQKNAQSFKFRSIHSFLNDVKYSSLKEVPIDVMTKREVEDVLVLPRDENNQQSFNQKHNRILMFGYSKEIMQDTVKAVAVENHWLFQEVDLSEIVLSFMKKNQNLQLEMTDQEQVRTLFKNAAKQSQQRNLPYVLLVKNIEDLLVEPSVYDEGSEFIEKVRRWLFDQLDAYVSLKGDVDCATNSENSPDLITVFVSNNPSAMHENLLQKLVQRAIYFDFPSLKSLKILLAQEIQHLNCNQRQFYFRDDYDNLSEEEKNRQRQYNNEYTSDYHQRNYNDYDYDDFDHSKLYERDNDDYYDDDYYSNNLRFASRKRSQNSQIYNQNFQPTYNYRDDTQNNQNSYRDQINHDDHLIRQILNRHEPEKSEQSSFLQIQKNQYRKMENMEKSEGKSQEQAQNQQYYERRDSNERTLDGDYLDEEDPLNDRQYSRRYQRKCRFLSKKLHYFHVIQKNNIQVVIEKRKDLSDKYNDNLLSDDNVIMIRGQRVCIVFDGDFDTYLMDHALPIKEKISNYNQRLVNPIRTQVYEKAGLIAEDIKNLLKVTINLQVLDQKNQRSLQRNYLADLDYYNDIQKNKENNDDQYRSSTTESEEEKRRRRRYNLMLMRDSEFEPYYVISEQSLKNGFLNYKPLVSTKQSNKILLWANQHNHKAAKIQALSSSVSELLMKNPDLNSDQLNLNLIKKHLLKNNRQQPNQILENLEKSDDIHDYSMGKNSDDDLSFGNNQIEDSLKKVFEKDGNEMSRDENSENCSDDSNNQINELKERIKRIRESQESNLPKVSEQSHSQNDNISQLQQRVEGSLKKLDEKISQLSQLESEFLNKSTSSGSIPVTSSTQKLPSKSSFRFQKKHNTLPEQSITIIPSMKNTLDLNEQINKIQMLINPLLQYKAQQDKIAQQTQSLDVSQSQNFQINRGLPINNLDIQKVIKIQNLIDDIRKQVHEQEKQKYNEKLNQVKEELKKLSGNENLGNDQLTAGYKLAQMEAIMKDIESRQNQEQQQGGYQIVQQQT